MTYHTLCGAMKPSVERLLPHVLDSGQQGEAGCDDGSGKWLGVFAMAALCLKLVIKDYLVDRLAEHHTSTSVCASAFGRQWREGRRRVADGPLWDPLHSQRALPGRVGTREVREDGSGSRGDQHDRAVGMSLLRNCPPGWDETLAERRGTLQRRGAERRHVRNQTRSTGKHDGRSRYDNHAWEYIKAPLGRRLGRYCPAGCGFDDDGQLSEATMAVELQGGEEGELDRKSSRSLWSSQSHWTQTWPVY